VLGCLVGVVVRLRGVVLGLGPVMLGVPQVAHRGLMVAVHHVVPEGLVMDLGLVLVRHRLVMAGLGRVGRRPSVMSDAAVVAGGAVVGLRCLVVGTRVLVVDVGIRLAGKCARAAVNSEDQEWKANQNGRGESCRRRPHREFLAV
jgi:hypothetical protein